MGGFMTTCDIDSEDAMLISVALEVLRSQYVAEGSELRERRGLRIEQLQSVFDLMANSSGSTRIVRHAPALVTRVRFGRVGAGS